MTGEHDVSRATVYSGSRVARWANALTVQAEPLEFSLRRPMEGQDDAYTHVQPHTVPHAYVHTRTTRSS